MSPDAICGLDEAGRGPLAGPVTAACVLLPPGFDRTGLADSKVLSPRQREALYRKLVEGAAWGLGWADAGEIDRVNILQASLRAMERAYDDLVARYPGLTISGAEADGLHSPALPVPCRAVVRGDATVATISAASILAKVSRDRYMDEAELRYPGYGFSHHKGYPTLAHRQALAELGPCPLHRLSFAGSGSSGPS